MYMYLKAVTCDMDLIQVPLDSGSSGSGRQKVSADLESPKGRPRWVETVTPFKLVAEPTGSHQGVHLASGEAEGGKQ